MFVVQMYVRFDGNSDKLKNYRSFVEIKLFDKWNRMGFFLSIAVSFWYKISNEQFNVKSNSVSINSHVSLIISFRFFSSCSISLILGLRFSGRSVWCVMLSVAYVNSIFDEQGTTQIESHHFTSANYLKIGEQCQRRAAAAAVAVLPALHVRT